MAIDRFSKERFEAALPVHKDNGSRLWVLAGTDTEYVYRMHVGGDVHIMIRSSVNPATGLADEAGEDSIRCWICLIDGAPLGNKLDKTYVTRVRGWEVRLKDLLTLLWRTGRKIVEHCHCGSQKAVFLCRKKESKYLGCRFVKCPQCGSMEWLDAPKELA